MDARVRTTSCVPAEKGTYLRSCSSAALILDCHRDRVRTRSPQSITTCRDFTPRSSDRTRGSRDSVTDCTVWKSAYVAKGDDTGDGNDTFSDCCICWSWGTGVWAGAYPPPGRYVYRYECGNMTRRCLKHFQLVVSLSMRIQCNDGCCVGYVGSLLCLHDPLVRLRVAHLPCLAILSRHHSIVPKPNVVLIDRT